MHGNEIETLSSRIVYENSWMKVREDAVRRADGSEGIYGVVEKKDFVVIAAVRNGMVRLVEQFRYPVGIRCWELPQGSWEGEDPDPIELARAELKEETGLTARSMRYVGRLFEAYGYSTQGFTIYLAQDLIHGDNDPDPEEQGLISNDFRLDDVEKMICEGEIRDSVTVAAFGMLKMKKLL